MKEVEGYLYLFNPKLVITELCFGDSEEFFGDSGLLLQRLRRCAETPHMAWLRTLRRNPSSGDSGKFSGNFGLFCRNTL
jgi:hypothetical protein